MKQVRIDTLLATPPDGVSYQREWTTHGQQRVRGALLEIALFAGAVGPGLYVVSAVAKFRLGLLAAFLIVLIGYGIPHLLFLGKVGRFWRGMLRPGQSWISRGFLFANVFLLFALLSVAHYVPALSAGPLGADSGAFGTIVWIAAAAAVGLAVYPGFLFGVLRAIPFWRSVFLAPLFVIQALGGGVALAVLLRAWAPAGGPALPTLLAADLALLAAAAGLIGAHLYFRGRSGPTGNTSVRQLLLGPYRKLFVFGAVLAGLAAPLALMALALLAPPLAWAARGGAILQLAGILLFKYCLQNVGAYRPLFDPRLLGEKG